MLRFPWMTLMACAVFAVISCSSRPVADLFHNATKAISTIVHEGHRFNHSVVTDVDYPKSFRQQDIHEIARLLEPEELQILARSLDTVDLEERQGAGEVIGVALEVLEKVFDIVYDLIKNDKAVSRIIPYLSCALNFLRSPRSGQDSRSKLFRKA